MGREKSTNQNKMTFSRPAAFSCYAKHFCLCSIQFPTPIPYMLLWVRDAASAVALSNVLNLIFSERFSPRWMAGRVGKEGRVGNRIFSSG